MTGVLIDSNVLIDILTDDSSWADWSREALRSVSNDAVVVINPVVYSEVGMGYPTIEALDDALGAQLLEREPIPFTAAFLAGRAFLDYRRRGGTRTSALPDFYIGAHASVAGYRLLTRDPRRYQTYFPRLQLIAPG